MGGRRASRAHAGSPDSMGVCQFHLTYKRSPVRAAAREFLVLAASISDSVPSHISGVAMPPQACGWGGSLPPLPLWWRRHWASDTYYVGTGLTYISGRIVLPG